MTSARDGVIGDRRTFAVPQDELPIKGRKHSFGGLAAAATPRRAFGDLKNVKAQQASSERVVRHASKGKLDIEGEETMKQRAIVMDSLDEALKNDESATVAGSGMRTDDDCATAADALMKEPHPCDSIDPDAPVEHFNWPKNGNTQNLADIIEEDLTRVFGPIEDRLPYDAISEMFATVATSKCIFRAFLNEEEIAKLDGDLIPDPFAEFTAEQLAALEV